MKNILNLFILTFLAINANSCKDKEGAPSDEERTEMLEITINGTTFTNEIYPGFNGFNSSTCDEKRAFFVNLTDPDLNSQFTINTDLQHYVNETDFDSVGTGDYSMTDDYLDDDYCHFTLYLSLDDNSQNNETKLEPGSVHKIISLSTVDSDENRKEVLVVGSFSGTYKNSVNSDIVVSGNYKKIIEILK